MQRNDQTYEGDTMSVVALPLENNCLERKALKNFKFMWKEESGDGKDVVSGKEASFEEEL